MDAQRQRRLQHQISSPHFKKGRSELVDTQRGDTHMYLSRQSIHNRQGCKHWKVSVAY